jgi:hypothetical protein
VVAASKSAITPARCSGREGGDDDDHTTDLPMADNVDVLLAINADAYLF